MEKQQQGFQTLEQCGRNAINYRNKENTMKSGMRDKAEGSFHEVRGKGKEITGILRDNPKLQVEGTIEKISGKVQEKIGQIKQVFGK